MNTAERLFARTRFRLLVYERDGSSYQDLAESVLVLRHPTFERVKPHGNQGDRKNDGFVRSTGTYFQMYAPEDPDGSVAKAAEKAESDFKGLFDYWNAICAVRDYRFAFNDKYRGSYPEIATRLAAIEKAHGLSNASVYQAQHLENDLFALTDEQIQFVTGTSPDPLSIPSLEYTALRDLVGRVQARTHGQSIPPILSVPDFQKKIEFNNISPYWGALLRAGERHAGAIEEYLGALDTFARQDLREAMSRLYSQNSQLLPSVQPSVRDSQGDTLCALLFNAIRPNNSKQAADASVAVMAYYFGSCDVFQDPVLSKGDSSAAPS